jgi:hypothetical protein
MLYVNIGNKFMKKTRTNFYVTRLQYEFLKKEAEKQEICISELFRKILDKYIQEIKK